MALGGYNVVKNKPAYKNVFVAASADGQKEALAIINKDGCDSRYISTGLNSPSLAATDALQIALDVSTGKSKPSDYEPESFTKAVGIDCNNIKEWYDPESVF
jgi:ribose transport system substrate-binding protein